MKKCYVYILQCADYTYYTGWTTDVQKRIATHNKGKGAKYTRGSRLPVELVGLWEFSCKENAMSVEYLIKRLSRKDKCNLIEESGIINVWQHIEGKALLPYGIGYE